MLKNQDFFVLYKVSIPIYYQKKVVYKSFVNTTLSNQKTTSIVVPFPKLETIFNSPFNVLALSLIFLAVV
jgi:hypothetical protein